MLFLAIFDVLLHITESPEEGDPVLSNFHFVESTFHLLLFCTECKILKQVAQKIEQ